MNRACTRLMIIMMTPSECYKQIDQWAMSLTPLRKKIFQETSYYGGRCKDEEEEIVIGKWKLLESSSDVTTGGVAGFPSSIVHSHCKFKSLGRTGRVWYKCVLCVRLKGAWCRRKCSIVLPFLSLSLFHFYWILNICFTLSAAQLRRLLHITISNGP